MADSGDGKAPDGMRLVGDLAWVAQGRCAACHVRLADSSCPECGASWRAGCGTDAVPWLQRRTWMRCRTWFIPPSLAGLAQDLLGADTGPLSPLTAPRQP
jgi:hypothetical protein